MDDVHEVCLSSREPDIAIIGPRHPWAPREAYNDFKYSMRAARSLPDNPRANVRS